MELSPIPFSELAKERFLYLLDQEGIEANDGLERLAESIRAVRTIGEFLNLHAELLSISINRWERMKYYLIHFYTRGSYGEAFQGKEFVPIILVRHAPTIFDQQLDQKYLDVLDHELGHLIDFVVLDNRDTSEQRESARVIAEFYALSRLFSLVILIISIREYLDSLHVAFLEKSHIIPSDMFFMWIVGLVFTMTCASVFKIQIYPLRARRTCQQLQEKWR